MPTPTQRAYTGATSRIDSQRFPEVYSDQAERQIVYVERESPWSWQSIAIAIGAGALLVAMARSGAYANSQHPDPAWQPPQPQTIIRIEDNSWNMCGLCWSNDAPEYVGGR